MMRVSLLHDVGFIALLVIGTAIASEPGQPSSAFCVSYGIL